ncbi:Hint domain-containing protein [Streptomyces sp. NPDC057137]|uniref:Hint domain-containing protein n=1 Tax=Streptomyces sp. NPDC057137 TaxID=3346030 RepID=UPI0036310611
MLGKIKWAAPAKTIPAKTCKIRLPNSFTADTPVLLADGTRKPIKDIQIGDQVLATDPKTGESGPRPVTALIKGTGDKQLVDITLTDGKTSTLTATDGHPFWVPALGRWIEADDLITGQWLQTSTGTWTEISTVTHHTKQTTVYNLTVDDIHTYYALAGATPVLVHNAGCDEFADELQQRMGGEIWTLTPKAPFPALGDYKLAKESWGHHTVVVKNGRVYDQFTGGDGMPIDAWRRQWDWPDDHDWTRKR